MATEKWQRVQNRGVAGPAGSDVHTAQIFMVSGTVQATRAADLADAVAARGAGSSHGGLVIKGKPAQLAGVTPGTYSACAMPLPIDAASPRDLAPVLGKEDQLLCACVPFTVTPDPATQAVTIPVPVPPHI